MMQGRMLICCVFTFIVACLLGVMTYFFLEEGGGEDRGPRYTLASFTRQWNIHSPNPRAQIHSPHKVEGGYAVDYGDSVSLHIVMRKDMVVSAHIRYDAGSDQGTGGPRFLLLMHTAINVGTFRWPQERIDRVRHLFGLMSPQPKSYRYLYTSFTRMYEQTGRWEFTLHYVPHREEENS